MLKRVLVIQFILICLCGFLVLNGAANVYKIEAESATEELFVAVADDTTASGGKLGCIGVDTEETAYGLVFDNVPTSTAIEFFYATPAPEAEIYLWIYTDGAYVKLADISCEGNGGWYIEDNPAYCIREGISIPENSKIKITANNSLNFDYINLVLAEQETGNPKTSDAFGFYLSGVCLSLAFILLKRQRAF